MGVSGRMGGGTLSLKNNKIGVVQLTTKNGAVKTMSSYCITSGVL